jgi:hypothetical protein
VSCPLCQETLVATSEAECIAHMAACTGFKARHPTNPDGSSQSAGMGESSGGGGSGGGGGARAPHSGYFVPHVDVVELAGLKAQPALNGRLALVLGWFRKGGRWAVELLGAEDADAAGGGGDGGQVPPAAAPQAPAGHRLKVKPANMVWVGTSSSTTPPPPPGATTGTVPSTTTPSDAVDRTTPQCTAGCVRRPLFGGDFGVEIPSDGWLDTHAAGTGAKPQHGAAIFVGEGAVAGVEYATITINQPVTRPAWAQVAAADALRAFANEGEQTLVPPPPLFLSISLSVVATYCHLLPPP